MTICQIIKAIDKASVHKICSGQVIVDLSIAVKELLENSLDANATIIEVKIKDHGLGGIEVIDNGTGISEDNFEKLALRHFTSKISDFDDIYSVSSFGFRGEALSSLCSMSNFTVVTSTEGPYGVKLSYDHFGKLVGKSSCARERGTTMALSNLFENLPVRFKEFKKNAKKEYFKCVDLMYAYGIICEGVKIYLVHIGAKGERNLVFTTKGNSNKLRDNMVSLFGTQLENSLMEIDCTVKLNESGIYKPREVGSTLQEQQANENSSIHVRGFISKPTKTCAKSANNRQYTFINKRPCLLGKIVKSVNEVYRSFVSDKYSVLILELIMKTDAYDVNVTPDKRDILIQDEKKIIEQLQAYLLEKFEPFRGMLISASTPMKQTSLLDDKFNFSSPQELLSTKKSSTFRADEENDKTHSKTTNSLMGSISAVNSLTNTSLKSKIITTDFSSRSARSVIEKNLVRNSETLAVKPFLPFSDFNCSDSKKDESITSHVSSALRKFLPIYQRYQEADHEEEDSSKKRLLTSEEEIAPKLVWPKRAKTVDVVEEQTKDDVASSRNNTNIGESVDHRDEEEENETVMEDLDAVDEKKVVNLIPEEKVSEHSGCCQLETNNSQDEVNKHMSSSQQDPEPNLFLLPSSSQPIKEDGEEEVASDNNSRTNSSPMDVLTGSDQYKRATYVAGDYKFCLTLPTTVALSFDLNHLRQNMEANNHSQVHTCSNDGKKGIENVKFTASIENSVKAEQEFDRFISKSDFEKMEILGQFNLGFIITRLNDDLFIIDQHASDEKYTYEQLIASAKIDTQRMVIPQKLSLTPQYEELVLDKQDQLRIDGWEVEYKNENPPGQKIYLKGVPQVNGITFTKDDFDEILHKLSENIQSTQMVRSSKSLKMFASKACRKSYMIGMPLEKAIMSRIVKNMGTMNHPWNCPHGRPTMRHLCPLSSFLKPLKLSSTTNTSQF